MRAGIDMSFDNRGPSDGAGTRHDIDTGKKTMKHVFHDLGRPQ